MGNASKITPAHRNSKAIQVVLCAALEPFVTNFAMCSDCPTSTPPTVPNTVLWAVGILWIMVLTTTKDARRRSFPLMNASLWAGSNLPFSKILRTSLLIHSTLRTRLTLLPKTVFTIYAAEDLFGMLRPCLPNFSCSKTVNKIVGTDLSADTVCLFSTLTITKQIGTATLLTTTPTIWVATL
ncbi:MAG: hypothetical protein BWX65_00755 [Bacteroidetes bacterium ADurb.Bin057]|nr:MAG: hypothetical protein BWX65_00755 [Bacteroidetes bacterium ADurb.Bin057]